MNEQTDLNSLAAGINQTDQQPDQQLDKLTYEAAVKSLEQVVAKLESSELTLDQSVSLFQKGMKLAQICTARLNDIEAKITKLIEKETGVIEEEPFGVDHE